MPASFSPTKPAKVDACAFPAGRHILFFNPPSAHKLYRGIVCTWLSKAIYVWKPLDFIILSGWVPPDIRLSHLDSFVHRVDLPQACDYVAREKVSLLVMAMSSIVWGEDLETLGAIRDRFPDLKIAVFGDVFQEREFVEQVLPLRAAVIRHPLAPGLRAFFETGRSTTPAVIENLGPGTSGLPSLAINSPVELPVPRQELFLNLKQRSPFDKYRRATIVNTNWSCPFKCSYCSYSSPYLPFAYRSAASVLAELEKLKKMGVREVFFGDPTFGTPRQVGLEILDGMQERGLRFSWHCYMTPKNVSDDFLERMAECGCHTIIVGVESSHPEELARFNRNISTSEIGGFVGKCHRLGMEVCGDFILGLNDSPDDWKTMTDFAIALRLDYASFNIYIPMLGARERKLAIEKGTIQSGEWGYDTTAQRKSLVKHAENRLKCVRRFFGRPGYWLRRLLKLRTFDEMIIKLEEFCHLFLVRK